MAAGPLAWLVLLLGLAASVLLIATEFSTIHSVRLGETTCGAADPADRDKCMTSGGDQHGYALVALGLLCALMTLGAVLGRSRPAAFAVLAIGLVVLFVALVLDLPTLDSTRSLELKYTGVKAQTGGAFTLELIGGALAVLTGALALLLARRSAVRDEDARQGRRARSEQAAAESGAA